LVDAQTVGVLVTAASVSVAAIYYVLTLRTNQRNLKMNLETRQSQFMSQISDELNSVENWKIVWELLSMEWTDWADFEKKYGSTGNPEAASKRFSLFGKFENVGWLLKNGMLDPEWVHSQFHANVTMVWLKFEPQIMQMRKAMRSPTIFIGFEYLGRKILEIEKVKAPEAVLPTDLKETNISRTN
jgi:hypothetical protein